MPCSPAGLEWISIEDRVKMRHTLLVLVVSSILMRTDRDKCDFRIWLMFKGCQF